MKLRLFVFACLLFTCASAFAADKPPQTAVCKKPTQSTVTNPKHVFGIAIEGSVQRGYLTLNAQLGKVIKHAVRVYSEPSHTLLVGIADTGFAASEAGKSWKSYFKVSNLITGPLVDTQPSVTVQARPPSDDRIAIWAAGFDVAPDEEFLIADGTVGNGAFKFATYIDPQEPADPTHCCSGGGCTEMCEDCTGPAFTCCLNTPCCAIACGHQICFDICPSK